MSGALGRLKARRAGLSAAQSHLLNDEYMDRFAAATSLGEGTAAGLETCAATRAAQPAVQRQRQQHRPPSLSSSPAPDISDTSGIAATSSSSSAAASFSSSSVSIVSSPSWWAGPAEPAGTTVPLAAANILCASVDWERGEAVFGSADHALYTLDLRRRAKGRTLYSRRFGHSEWVTAVAHLPASGGLVSGGMDSKLCLWDRSRAACRDLEGHSGSISQLEVVPGACAGGKGTLGPGGRGETFLSASYDKTVRLWDAASGRCLAVLSAHKAPVLQLCTTSGSSSPTGAAAAASGDRSGDVVVWDLAAGRPSRSFAGAHAGHITALAWGSCSGSSSSSSAGGSDVQTALGRMLLLSGGQDGCLKLWDCRAQRPAAQAQAHSGPSGKGAVGSIAPPLHGGDTAGGLVVTAGADGRVRGIDAQRGLQQAWEVQLRDFPYSMAAAAGGRLVLVGCGDGSLWVIDRTTGRVLYALGASTAAVRTIHAAPQQLVVGGDDGTAMVYDFN